MSSKWDSIAEAIRESENFVIFTHTNMDGDAMGSASALCHALKDMGKKAVILLEDNIPHYLDVIHNHSDFFTDSVDFEDYTAIAVDCGDESRIEKRLEAYRKAKLHLCIDHHMQDGKFAEFSVVEPDAAAAGMLVYQLLKELNCTIHKEIAEDLYVAISTDTGCFKYDKADAEVHSVIAELFRSGIDHTTLCNAIYSTFPLSQMKLEGIAIDHAEVFAGGKAVISYVMQEDIRKAGSSYEEADTCIDRIRCIENTEVACMIKENNEGKLKVSLRSKNYADINKVAKAFGGGGHFMASGCTLECTLEEAAEKLKQEIIKVL